MSHANEIHISLIYFNFLSLLITSRYQKHSTVYNRSSIQRRTGRYDTLEGQKLWARLAGGACQDQSAEPGEVSGRSLRGIHQ
jgi:hypothetical protein